jgi:hypothetical protein
VLTGLTGSLFAAAAIGNDLALRDRPSSASRFGPTDPRLPLPACDALLVVPSTAAVSMSLDGSVDGHSLGNVVVGAVRSGSDARADLTIATALHLERRADVRIGGTAFGQRNGRWSAATPAAVAADLTLDDAVLASALGRRNRSTAEFRGEEFVEGARARHCRIATDGPTFLAAFPATSLLVGPVDLHRWRGQLDYWIFADGAVGRLSGSVNGDAAGLPAAGIQGRVRVQMTIVDRGRPLAIAAPIVP